MSQIQRKAALAVTGALCLGLLLFSGIWHTVRQRLCAERTMLNMRTVAVVLASAEMKLGELDTRRAVFALKTRGIEPEILTDAWGSPLVLEANLTPGATKGLHMKITSLGRDRRRGSCCRGELAKGSWDEDAVIEGTVWLQYWDF